MLSGDPSAGIAEEIRGNAGRLGMQWQILSGTVQEANSATNLFARVRLDGDAADSKAWSMVGAVLAGDRVSIIKVPPEGAYIVGWSAAVGHALADQAFRGALDAQTTVSASYSNLNSGGSVARISLTKVRDDTRLAYDFDASCFSTAVNTSVQYGLLVDGTDYDTAFARINLGSVHVFPGASGFLGGVGAIPAGTYDIDARWRRVAGAGTLSNVANEALLAFRVQEVV